MNKTDNTTIVLELTDAEACALRQVCQSIGGRPDLTARGLFDEIDRALSTAGVPIAEHAIHHSASVIYFII